MHRQPRLFDALCGLVVDVLDVPGRLWGFGLEGAGVEQGRFGGLVGF